MHLYMHGSLGECYHKCIYVRLIRRLEFPDHDTTKKMIKKESITKKQFAQRLHLLKRFLKSWDTIYTKLFLHLYNICVSIGLHLWLTAWHTSSMMLYMQVVSQNLWVPLDCRDMCFSIRLCGCSEQNYDKIEKGNLIT